MKFKCMGNDPSGKYKEIELKAKNRDEAFKRIKEMGFSNISIIEKSNAFSRQNVKAKDISMVFKQLAAFAEAGESFSKSLASVADVTQNQTLKEALISIRRDVEGGKSISASFAEHSMFPKIVINLLKVGESSGEMEKTLDELSKYLNQIDNIESSVKAALLYPKIIISVMFLAMIFMISNVLPKFRQFYTDMHIEMPLTTKLMYALSDFINNEWFLALPTLAIIVYILKNLKNYIPRTFDYMLVNLPVIKSVMLNLYMFRFCKTMQILIGANVDIIESLKLTADTMENHLFADPILESIPMVKGGSGITSSIRGNDTEHYYDAMAVAFLQTGEDTNNISELMGKASDYYQRQLALEIDSFGKAIEPVLLVIIAFFVLILVTSVYLPIFKMSQIKL